jgi:MFS family permease
MAPQGLGAAFAMPISGRLTDRFGGGIVATVGIVVMTFATVPFAFVGGDTSYALLAVLLVVRGVGMGGAMMPSMAAAYAVLGRAAVPRATSALNVVQRVGGSIGTAVLAVILQHELGAGPGLAGTGGKPLGALTDAFAHTFWWAVAFSAVAVIPAAVLALTTRRERLRAQAGDRRELAHVA